MEELSSPDVLSVTLPQRLWQEPFNPLKGTFNLSTDIEMSFRNLLIIIRMT